jgi:hypothetical protein
VLLFPQSAIAGSASFSAQLFLTLPSSPLSSLSPPPPPAAAAAAVVVLSLSQL